MTLPWEGEELIMQIAVVEIPTDQIGDQVGDSSEAPLSVSAEPVHGRASTSGLWVRATSAAAKPTERVEPGGRPHHRAARASGVFPAIGDMGEFPSANDVWRWVPPPGLESPEGCLRLVVFQRGATWPPFLARDLSGGVTTCIVPEVLGDGLSGLVQRVAKRASQVELPVTQLIWISGESRRTAPLRFVRQLAEAVDAVSTVLVVNAQTMGAARRRHGRRRRPSGEGSGESELSGWTEDAAASA